MPIEYRKYGPPTAYAFSKQIGDFGDGSVLLQVWRWNCWGEPRDGPGASYQVRAAGEQIKTGLISYVTVDMLINGCCTELMKAEIIGDISPDADTEGGIEEAMALHTKGYGITSY